jgi:hypothetical protein
MIVIDKSLQVIRDHGTKLLGLAQGTVAAIAGVDGIIPHYHLKYYLAASAVLTVWRGFFNSSQK